MNNYFTVGKMATGDLKNNLRKLQSALKLVNYEKDSDFERYLFFEFLKVSVNNKIEFNKFALFIAWGGGEKFFCLF